MTSQRAPTIVHLLDSLNFGGTQHALASLLHRLPRERFQHLVVTLRGAGPIAQRLPDHVACRALGISGASSWAGLTIARIVRRTGAKILHARNTGCWFDAVTAQAASPRLRTVLGFHGFDRFGGLTDRRRRIARLGDLLGCRIASVSESAADMLADEARMPRDRIKVIANGVDLERFHPADKQLRCSVRAELGISQDAFVVGAVGSIVPIKRHADLLDALTIAAADIPSLCGLIIGDGPGLEALQARRCESVPRHRVIFAGHSSQPERLFQAFDVFVCCSEAEGMSNAVLEAMASQLPIVATDVGDNARLIADGIEGLIVPIRSPHELARAIRRLFHDPEFACRIAISARNSARNFSLDRCAALHVELYESLLGRKQDHQIVNEKAAMQTSNCFNVATRPT